MGEINLDPDEDYLNARRLTVLIDRWLVQLDVLPVTRVAYRGKIRHFSDWWERIGPENNWRLTPSLLQAFELYLRGLVTTRFDTLMAYSSRHAIMRTLRMMFKWAATKGHTSKNYGEWVPWPSGSTPARRSVMSEHLAALMLATLKSRYPLRDQALLAFFIGTGCRLSEVSGLQVQDLRMLADYSGTVVVVGKRIKSNTSGEHAVAFDAATGKYLVKYMDSYVVAVGPLWLGENCKKLTTQGIYQIVKRTVKRAKLTEYIHGCHDLRRAFATILGRLHPDSPAWADMIRRQLGHTKYEMTAHYTLMDAEDIRDRLLSPLSAPKDDELDN